MGCPNDIYVIAVMQSAKHETKMSDAEKDIIRNIGFEVNTKRRHANKAGKVSIQDK